MNDQYIESVLARHQLTPGLWTPLAANHIVSKLKGWAGIWLNDISFIGSIAKGTAIAGTTDLDIFISLKPATPLTLKDVYESLFATATSESWLPRQQNVSIGINYLGVKIDLVPGKLQEGYIYFHSLWKRKTQSWTQ